MAFADDTSSIVVAFDTISGSSLYMYGEEKQKEQQAKLPLPGIKWEHHNIHEKRSVLTISGATATYGTADGSAVIASCSEGLIFPNLSSIFDCNGREVLFYLCCLFFKIFFFSRD